MLIKFPDPQLNALIHVPIEPILVIFSLGISHDTTGGCVYADQFIMASGRSKNYVKTADPGAHWTFSQCSVNAMSISLKT